MNLLPLSEAALHAVEPLLGERQQVALASFVEQAAEDVPRRNRAEAEVRVIDESPANRQGGGVGLLVESRQRAHLARRMRSIRESRVTS